MKRLAVIGVLFVLALPAYLAGVGRNPPGYFVDEAAISYNAWCIETHGVDEFDIPYPLFFKSGGDYKNPVYIYLLALMFKIFGPSVGLARGQSAVLGDLGAAAFAWLAWSMSGRRWVAIATFLLAFATAAYWEVAHIVFEVSAYPFVLALFLIALWYARDRWRIVNVAGVGVMLAVVTYTYTTGRLLGPLLALGLVFFLRRDRIRPIVATWAIYAILGPIPMAVFHFTNDHALTARYRIVRAASDKREVVENFLSNYVLNADPIGETLVGDIHERHHVPHSGGNVLGATFILAAAGAIVAWRRRDPWDKFLIYAVFASLVPVSLTYGSMHLLRVMPYFAFLTALSIEGMMTARRPLLAIAFVLAVVQAAWFFHVWARDSGRRVTVFDCCVPPVVDVALAQHRFPIYLHGLNFSPDVLWFATLRGVDRSHFVIYELPPPGAIAITNLHPPEGAHILAHDQLFYAYVAR